MNIHTYTYTHTYIYIYINLVPTLAALARINNRTHVLEIMGCNMCIAGTMRAPGKEFAAIRIEGWPNSTCLVAYEVLETRRERNNASRKCGKREREREKREREREHATACTASFCRFVSLDFLLSSSSSSPPPPFSFSRQPVIPSRMMKTHSTWVAVIELFPFRCSRKKKKKERKSWKNRKKAKRKGSGIVYR